MLHAFVRESGVRESGVRESGLLHWSRSAAEHSDLPLPPETLWIDLLAPTQAELARTEALVGHSLPTREQMAEIEESSRLRIVGGALFMTVSALVWADTDQPRLATISFVLSGGRIVTIHDIDPQAFLAYRRRVAHGPVSCRGAESVLAALVDGMVERTSAVLRRVGLELDTMGSRAFRGRTLRPRGETRDDTRVLRRIGQAGHLIGKAHVSLAGMIRMLDFLARTDGWNAGKQTRRWARATLLDVTGLDEYARFLTGKVGLLLDTALGRINVEQTEIVKIVSVLTVLLFPPTLVASLYGMNFTHMPEKEWGFGYPLALCLMVLSAVLPMLLVKARRWL